MKILNQNVNAHSYNNQHTFARQEFGPGDAHDNPRRIKKRKLTMAKRTIDSAKVAEDEKTRAGVKPGASPRPTSYDVARLARVSQSAVSRALTPGAYISADLRDKVLEAARQLGYQPNAMARGLTTSRSRVVALFMPNSGNPIYPLVLQGFSQRFRALDHQVLLLPPVGTAAEGLACLLQYRVDALVITAASPLALSKAIARKCLAAKIPLVLFNRYFSDLKIPSVSCDNYRAGAHAADMLVAAGHRRLAFVGGLEATSTHVDRCNGFVERLRALKVAEPLIEAAPYNYDGGHAAGLKLLAGKRRPDGIFCANDMMAIGVLDAARVSHGIRVPEELSIIGFDGAPMAAWAGNDLTTFRMRVDEMVEAAVGLVINAIESPGSSQVPRLHIPSEFVVRTSARLPPGVPEHSIS